MAPVIKFVIMFRKILTHPLLLIFSFCAIVISGEHTGGIYLLYLAMGLPILALHSIVGGIGILCLLLSQYGRGRSGLINILGMLCMIVSLFLFFLQPNGSYNYATFSQVVPMASLIVFSILAVVFIVVNGISLMRR